MSPQAADYVWKEPARGGYATPYRLSLSGLERIRGAIKGRFRWPPIRHLFGLRPVEAGVGTCTFLTPASPWLQSVHGAYTGGVYALAADAALGGAVATGIDPWHAVATSQLCMNFLRPAGPWSGRLTARGRLIHTTPTVGLSEVHIEDAEGRLLAHGTSRCFLQRIEPQHDIEPEPDQASMPAYDTPDPYLRPVEGAMFPSSFFDGHSGLELLRMRLENYHPSPVHLLLGHELIEVDDGRGMMRMPAHSWLCNPDGKVYGGATANLAHDTMSVAITSTLPKGTGYATLDLTLNFVRPIPADGRDLQARAHVVHRGRTFAVTAAEVVNSEGKTVATSSASWIILPGRSVLGRPDFVNEFPGTGE